MVSWVFLIGLGLVLIVGLAAIFFFWRGDK
jgi:hypothetical protein